jgi:hypothetical protein
MAEGNTDIITMEELNKVLKHAKDRKSLDQVTYQWKYLNLEETNYKCTYWSYSTTQ